GGTVLGYGIASIVTTCLRVCLGLYLGIKAVSMANEDLAAMEEGRMDDAGRGSTQAGKICGIIGIVLSILTFVCNIIMIAASKK
ncbi:MAG TPA: hypothetical protein VGZ47_04450, partial [Gemmataceae bacterium]|nr:hypothetical protein [Gemmataceae bacterium]